MDTFLKGYAIGFAMALTVGVLVGYSLGANRNSLKIEVLLKNEAHLIQMFEDDINRIPDQVRQNEEEEILAWQKYEKIRTRIYAKADAAKQIQPSLDTSYADSLEQMAYAIYKRTKKE